MLKRILLLGLVCALGFGAMASGDTPWDDSGAFNLHYHHNSRATLEASGSAYKSNFTNADFAWLVVGAQVSNDLVGATPTSPPTIRSLNMIINGAGAFRLSDMEFERWDPQIKFEWQDSYDTGSNYYPKHPDGNNWSFDGDKSEGGLQSRLASADFTDVRATKRERTLTLDFRKTADQLKPDGFVPHVELVTKTVSGVTYVSGVRGFVASKDVADRNSAATFNQISGKVRAAGPVWVEFIPKGESLYSSNWISAVKKDGDMSEYFAGDEKISFDFDIVSADDLKLSVHDIKRVETQMYTSSDIHPDWTRYADWGRGTTWNYYTILSKKEFAGDIIQVIETDANFAPLANPLKDPDHEERRFVRQFIRSTRREGTPMPTENIDVTFDKTVRLATNTYRKKGPEIRSLSAGSVSKYSYDGTYNLNYYNTVDEYWGDSCALSADADVYTAKHGDISYKPLFTAYKNLTWRPRIKPTFDSSGNFKTVEAYLLVNGVKTIHNDYRVGYIELRNDRGRLERMYVEPNMSTASYIADFSKTNDGHSYQRGDVRFIRISVNAVESGRNLTYMFLFYPGYGDEEIVPPISRDVTPEGDTVTFNPLLLDNYSELSGYEVPSGDIISTDRGIASVDVAPDVKQKIEEQAKLIKTVRFDVPYTRNAGDTNQYVLPTTLAMTATSADLGAAVWENIEQATTTAEILDYVHMYKLLNTSGTYPTKVVDLVAAAGSHADKVFTAVVDSDGGTLSLSAHLLIRDAASPEGAKIGGVVAPNSGAAGNNKHYILLVDGALDNKFTDPMALGAPTTTPPPPPPPDDDNHSSGGCSAGYAPLALLLAAPLFFRRKK